MTKKIVFGVMTVALVAFVAAPSASASCNPNKTASTFGSGTTAYWLPATVVGTASLQSWQLGAPGNWASTGCPSDGLFGDGPGFSLNFQMGTCGAGCPTSGSTLAILAQNRVAVGTEFLLATVIETPASANAFDYGPQGNHTMIPIPKPFVISSTRSGSNVNLVVKLPSIAGGLFGPNAASAVTGFNLLSASSTTNPGSAASAYSLRSTVASPGGAEVASQPLTVDCSNINQDQWVVTQIQFENGTVLGNSVSAPVRVNCNPALATPKTPPKVKVAPKLRAN